MGIMEMDGMTVDQIIYWWDQPVVYLGRMTAGDDRPCLVLMVEESQRTTVYHRLRFADERGLRRTLASGCAATPDTYGLAQDMWRLELVSGEEDWVPTTFEEILERDGPTTALPPGRSKGDVEMDMWGVDHWTLLRYLHARHLAARNDADPTIEYQRLRINPQNNNLQISSAWSGQQDSWSGSSGTRLKGFEDDPTAVATLKHATDAGLQIPYHDDFDCIEEFEAEGLIDMISTANGVFRMTKAGTDLAERVERHLADGRRLDELRP